MFIFARLDANYISDIYALNPCIFLYKKLFKNCHGAERWLLNEFVLLKLPRSLRGTIYIALVSKKSTLREDLVYNIIYTIFLNSYFTLVFKR